jgi:glutamine synthetase
MSYCIEYVWIDGDYKLRSKVKTIDYEVFDVVDVPTWNYDGSSTNQSNGDDSDIMLIPCSLFINYNYMEYDNNHHKYIVLCDTYKYDITSQSKLPCNTNNRYMANNIFFKSIKEYPWFGLEQEYFMIDNKTNLPLGFDKSKTQGQYYCSVGSRNSYGRKLSDEHLYLCMSYGVKISGTNAEVAPGQWEFQIGPCVGIEAGDHLWLARFLLLKLSEKYQIHIDFSSKPLKGDWNGSGCHTNYSTIKMREGNGDKTGIEYINSAIDKLSKKHPEHMLVYGDDNLERMSGLHETSSYYIFSNGVSNRGASVRIGKDTIINKCGYFEDRRPSSNCDPYLVTSIIFKTTVLD